MSDAAAVASSVENPLKIFSHLAERCMHTREDPKLHQIQTQNQAKQDDRPKEPGRNAHKSDTNYHKGATPSPPVCLSPGTVVFFLLINSSLFSLFSFFVEILFCKAEGPGPLSLTAGLVARTWCSHSLDSAPDCGWEPKPLSKLLQAKSIRDQLCHLFPSGPCLGSSRQFYLLQSYGADSLSLFSLYLNPVNLSSKVQYE